MSKNILFTFGNRLLDLVKCIIVHLLGKEDLIQPWVLNNRPRWLLTGLPLEEENQTMNGPEMIYVHIQLQLKHWKNTSYNNRFIAIVYLRFSKFSGSMLHISSTCAPLHPNENREISVARHSKALIMWNKRLKMHKWCPYIPNVIFKCAPMTSERPNGDQI